MNAARRPRPDHLLACLDAVVAGLEDLLVYLRATEQLLRQHAGRLGPALLGGIEAAADEVRDRDRVRGAAVGLLAERWHVAPGDLTLATLAAVAAPWQADVLARGARLRHLVDEVDRAATGLRRLSRRPVAVRDTRSDADNVQALLHDALDQGLEQLLPAGLRAFAG